MSASCVSHFQQHQIQRFSLELFLELKTFTIQIALSANCGEKPSDVYHSMRVAS